MITGQALSNRLGFTYNITVANKSVSPDSVVDSVADGTYDIAASWITINTRRMDFVSFSHPCYSTSMSFVYRAVQYEVRCVDMLYEVLREWCTVNLAKNSS